MRYVDMPGGASYGNGAPTAWTGTAPLIAPEDWTKDAVCSQTDPEMFFPEKGGSTREAKKQCRSCDVIEECLAYALRNHERFGIWGGLSERERRPLLEKTRTCQDCTADISHLHPLTRFCESCNATRPRRRRAA